jgi:transposase-like protein
MSEYYNARSEDRLDKEDAEGDTLKCPECGSENVKRVSPIAKRYKDGFPPVPPEPAKYHCWDCDYNWKN